MTIWIDVEDMFDYARANSRPSGIQRLAFEIQTVLQRQDRTDVGFVRHTATGGSVAIVPWAEVEAVFQRLAQTDVAPPARAWWWDAGRSSLAQWLPMQLRIPLRRFVLLQLYAFRALRDLLMQQTQPAGAAAVAEDAPIAPPSPVSFAARARPGDVFLALGAPWFDAQYGTLLARLRRDHGLHTALLLYDLIPLRRPEWCHRSLVEAFGAWFEAVLPVCDTLFAISRATAADVELFARQRGVALRGPVRPIPIGTGFGGPGFGGASPGHGAEATPLPPPGSYVLFVSTIEARKNHTLLFRVWRHLLAAMPREDVPTLVFAGRVGWLVADLMQQLDNADYLDGKIVIIRDPTDEALARLYRGCLFTVFPSLFEGWGLPVTESLAFGKPCVISDRTSLPEAGGAFARYFNPDDVADATRVIRETLEDRPGLAAWEAHIAQAFCPVPWSAAADAILAGLPQPMARPRVAALQASP